MNMATAKHEINMDGQISKTLTGFYIICKPQVSVLEVISKYKQAALRFQFNMLVCILR
jgi:hypothetical protein